MLGIAEALRDNRTVTITAGGSSMTPLIRDGDRVRIVPADGLLIEEGDIVFARVKGRYYLHKVTHITTDRRYVIGNNRGHTNGIASEILGLFAGIVEK